MATRSYLHEEVFRSQRKLCPDVAFVDSMHPSAHTHDAVEHDSHPPGPSPKLKLAYIFGWRKIRTRSVSALCRKRPGVVETKGNGDTSLEAGKYPYL
jgi:hypothetical protein